MLHLFREWSEVQILYRRMWCWRTSRCRRSRLPVWKPKEQGRRSRSSGTAQCFAVSSRAAWRASDSADAACDCGGGGADHLSWTGGKETAEGAAGQADPKNGSKNLPVSLSVGHRCRSWLGNSSNRCRTRPQISGGRARRIYACLPSDRETYLR